MYAPAFSSAITRWTTSDGRGPFMTRSPAMNSRSGLWPAMSMSAASSAAMLP
jgi:hypothetical protein